LLKYFRFLLASLHLKSLARKHNRRDVRVALETLPKELNETYDEIMGRINDQQTEDVELANRVLMWISYAQRPLHVPELQYAVAVTPSSTELDEGALTDPELLLSVCAGLITIDHESNIIRLVHYTTQEYLLQNRDERFPNAKINIPMSCLTYIALVRQFWIHDPEVIELRNGKGGKDPFLSRTWQRHVERTIRKYPLLQYASTYWSKHLDKDQDHATRTKILDFVQADSMVPVAVFISEMTDDDSHAVCWDMSPLHVAARYGLKEAVEILLEKGADLNELDGWGRTALHWAAYHGQVTVIQSLLDKGIDIDAKDGVDKRALTWAIMQKHEDAVQVLSDKGSAPNLVDGGMRTMDLARRYGTDAIVELLLKSKYVVD
jgi:hypothetical protein